MGHARSRFVSCAAVQKDSERALHRLKARDLRLDGCHLGLAGGFHLRTAGSPVVPEAKQLLDLIQREPKLLRALDEAISLTASGE